MKRILKSVCVLGLFLSTAAKAEDLRVKFSVVDWQSYAKIDWQSGWGTIHVYATGPDGKVYTPSEETREGDTFVFPAAGLYTFDGDGAYVCGLNHGQKIEITANIVEIRLFGWCE